MPSSSRPRSKNSCDRVALGSTGLGSSLYRLLGRLARTSILTAMLSAAACNVSTDRVALCSVSDPATANSHIDLDQMMVFGSDTRLPIIAVRTHSAVGMISPWQLMVPTGPIATLDIHQKWETADYVFTSYPVPIADWFIVHAEPIDKKTTLQSFARETTALFSRTQGLVGFERHFYEYPQINGTATVCRGSRLKLENIGGV